MLRIGHQEHCLDLRIDLHVHSDHLEFIFEIRYRAQAPNDHRRADIACKVHQQIAVRFNRDLDPIGLRDGRHLMRDHFDPFGQCKQRALGIIGRYPDHHLIDQFCGPANDVHMTIRDRIECSRI